jgi:predicted NUDIX family NTP pyrophosphohydrolase
MGGERNFAAEALFRRADESARTGTDSRTPTGGPDANARPAVDANGARGLSLPAGATRKRAAWHGSYAEAPRSIRAQTMAAGKRSAGILLHRRRDGEREVLLVHPGGPFWAKKDAGAWSIPKGEYEDGEDARACALREFAEELGSPPPDGELVDLGDVRQRSGKVVTAWALAGDADADAVNSNTFTMEWPPRSGKMREFPEVDRAAWFALAEARERILPAQAPLLDRLAERA